MTPRSKRHSRLEVDHRRVGGRFAIFTFPKRDPMQLPVAPGLDISFIRLLPIAVFDGIEFKIIRQFGENRPQIREGGIGAFRIWKKPEEFVRVVAFFLLDAPGGGFHFVEIGFQRVRELGRNNCPEF